MIRKLTITELPIQEKKVLMRVDFNVPFDSSGSITDDTRIKAALPSIRFVLDNGGALILMSHLGRPKGEVKKEFSLGPVAKRLSELVGRDVIFAPDCVGAEVSALASKLKPGQILLLENLRFHKAEENPDSNPSFARELASLGDVYVNDAFGAAHRNHSSIVPITKSFPGLAAAGFLLEKEIEFLGASLLAPKHPFVAVIGGAKVSTKMGVLKALIQRVDSLLIGGGMAYTFFKALNIPVGNSLVEEELVGKAKEILAFAKEKKVQLLLPTDTVVVMSMSKDAKSKVVTNKEGIPDGFMGVDIGPQTIKAFEGVLSKAATVLWNGPVGVFEIPAFAVGTHALARKIASLDATTIVGGGDSVAAIHEASVADKIDHISTGGGASLEYIEFGSLPGIEALSSAPKTQIATS